MPSRRECRVPNPLLNEKKLEADRAGWAAPTPPSPAARSGRRRAPLAREIDDGPVSPWRPGMMTVRGTITATAVLFVLLLVSATFGWIVHRGEPGR